MTRKRGARENYLDTDVSRPTKEPAPEPIDADDEELDSVFAGFPQHDDCIELFRTTEKGGKPAFLEDVSPADFTFGYVASAYGGGRYIAKGKYKDGTYVKRNFDIEGASFPLKRKLPAEAAAVHLAAAQPQVERVELVKDERGQPDALATMMSMMKTLVVELRSSEDQVLDKMMKYKALFGSSESKTPIQESIGLIKTGIELGGASQGDGGFPWLLALDKLQGPLTELVSTIKAAVTQSRPGFTPVQPALQPQPAQPEPGPAPSEGEQKEMILLGAMNAMLPMLITGAAQKADPGFYSDLLLDQIPRQFYATAKMFLEKPDCLDRLTKINPAVGSHVLWFDGLRAELIAALATELGNAPGTIQSEQAPNAATDGSADL